MLVAGGHDLLVHREGGAGCQGATGFAQGVIHPGDLGGLHIHGSPFLQVDNGGGVHYPLAAAFAFAVVLFHIAQVGALPHMEGMDAVMGGFLGSGAVDAAARDDDHIGVFANIEVIVDQVLETGLADHHGAYRPW